MESKRYRLTVEFTATDDEAARQIEAAIHGTYLPGIDCMFDVVPDSLQYEVSYFTSVPRPRPAPLEVAS